MKKLAQAVIAIGGILALLIYSQDILIPFLYGIILWFLGHTLKKLAYKVPLFRNHFPSWLVSSLIFILIVASLSIVTRLITSNIDILIQSYPEYVGNVNNITDKINAVLNIDIYQSISEKLKDFEFGALLQPIADSLSGILSDTVMVLLYAIFIVSEETSFITKLKKIFKNDADYDQATAILKKINDSISDYIRLKTLVSILTGIVSYIFLSLMDVDAPFFWALLTFFLNYIPTIG